MKHAPYHVSSGKCKLKQQSEISTIHLLELARSGTLPCQGAGEDYETTGALTTADEVPWHNHFGRQFGGFLQEQTYSPATIQQLHLLLLAQVFL